MLMYDLFEVLLVSITSERKRLLRRGTGLLDEERGFKESSIYWGFCA